MAYLHETSAEAQTRALRLRVAQLRKEIVQATHAYRDAAAQHDTQRTIPLLRRRSCLMRQLLETQCELLLSLRGSETAVSNPSHSA
jgi:hypothetical protein